MRSDTLPWCSPGDAPPPTDAQVTTLVRRLAATLFLANLGMVIGAGLLGWLVVPGVQAPRDAPRLTLNGVVLALLFVGTAVHGLRWSVRRQRRGWAWTTLGRPPTAEEQLLVLRTPLAVARLTAWEWALGLVVLTAINVPSSGRFAVSLATTILFTGLATCAVAYLATEIVLRPLAVRILAARRTDERALPGLLPRHAIGWLLATGSSVVGLLVIGIIQLADPRSTPRELAIAMVVFAVLALTVGLALEVIAAKATAVRLERLRAAAAAVQGGALDTRVDVDDATDVGLLQDGFNRMTEGLRERARLRDAFTRHVGDDVARYALGDDGLLLGGQTREVSALFVDLTGSTAMAASHAPEEVVAVLNRFFAVVVGAVTDAGGSINKFEGDAALAVFGAPDPLPDDAGAALSAARAMARDLPRAVPELGFGIGVARGPVVAGNVGSEQRLEYTVIGDPVNEAARLSDLAKEVDGGVAASAAVVQAAPGGRDDWRHERDVVLRGRAQPTAVMAPVAGD